MKSHLSISFNNYSEPSFFAKLEQIETAFGTAAFLAAFPGPWGDPAKIPPMAQILSAIGAFKPLYNAAKGGDKGKIATRNAARVTLTDMLQAVAPVLEVAAGYDHETLMLTGYDLKKDAAVHSSSVTPGDAPQNVKAVSGNASGGIVVGAHTVSGATGYETQTNVIEPVVEANWQHAVSSSGSTHIAISGLVPLKVVYVRMRAIFGKKGPGPWSETVSIIVT